MDARGPLMLLAGAALMLSPLAIWLMREAEADPAVAAAVSAPDEAAPAAAEEAETVAQAEPACTAATVISTSERVDCTGETTKDEGRRVMSGGAVFVRVED